MRGMAGGIFGYSFDVKISHLSIYDVFRAFLGTPSVRNQPISGFATGDASPRDRCSTIKTIAMWKTM